MQILKNKFLIPWPPGFAPGFVLQGYLPRKSSEAVPLLWNYRALGPTDTAQKGAENTTMQNPVPKDNF